MFGGSVLKGVIDMFRVFTSVLAISIAMILTAGCQEEQATPSEKMDRLAAAENRDLKAQLEAQKKQCGDEKTKEEAKSQAQIKKLEDEIKNLNTKLASQKKNLEGQLQDLSKQFNDCRSMKAAEMQKESDKQVWDMVIEFAQKNEELTAEVNQLKAELAKAKAGK